MTNDKTYLFVDVHPSKSKLTLFLDSKCLWIACTVGVYSLRQMVLSVLADPSTNSHRNSLSDSGRSRFNLEIDGIYAETNPNVR